MKHTPPIKWGSLCEKKEVTAFTYEESWNQAKNTISKGNYATLRVTKPGKRLVNGNTWFWNDDLQMKVHEKTASIHKLLVDKISSNWQIYKHNNREAEKIIGLTWTVHYKVDYDKLDTRNGEQDLNRLTKSRYQCTYDMEHFCCINKKNETLLINQWMATNRCFEQIPTKELVHLLLYNSPISVTETQESNPAWRHRS